MSEIEQLRADIAKAKEIMLRFYKQDRQALGLGEMYDRLAKLEAEEAEKADRWADAKRAVKRWEQTIAKYGVKSTNGDVCEYVRNLEQRVAELEKQLASEKQQVDNVDSMAYVFLNDLEKAQARIADLEAQLAKRPVVWCVRNREKEYEKGVYGIRLFSTEKDAERYSLHTLHEPYTGEQS